MAGGTRDGGLTKTQKDFLLTKRSASGLCSCSACRRLILTSTREQVEQWSSFSEDFLKDHDKEMERWRRGTTRSAS
jgi:hypothetical protein